MRHVKDQEEDSESPEKERDIISKEYDDIYNFEKQLEKEAVEELYQLSDGEPLDDYTKIKRKLYEDKRKDQDANEPQPESFKGSVLPIRR